MTRDPHRIVHLDWYRSDSADDKHNDQEVDLDKIGNPGNASWAYASPGHGQIWDWAIFDRWLYDDAEEMANGHEATEEDAKAAVEAWVTTHPPTEKVTMDNFSVMIQVFAHINFVDGKPTEIVVEPDADKDFFHGLDTDDGRRLTEDGYLPNSNKPNSFTDERPADIEEMYVAWDQADLHRLPWRVGEHIAPERRRVINGHKVMVYPSGYPGQWVYLIDDTEGTPESFDSEAEAWGEVMLRLDSMGALPPFKS